MLKKSLWLASVLVVLFWTASAQAQSQKYPITGDMRFQIGNGLPIPITFAPPPAGGVDATPFAWISQTTGADPKKITMAKPRIFVAPGTPMVLPLFNAAPALLEIYTAISLNLPSPVAWTGTTNVFSAGGRTGSPTVTWCPGKPLPQTGTPTCADPLNDSDLTFKARARFMATANQFGGPLAGQVGGWVDLAMKGGANPPCHYATNMDCLAKFAAGPPLGSAANGGPFGFTVLTTGNGIDPGLFQVGVTPNGIIITITTVGLGPGVGNPVTSWALPWTTGQLVNTAWTIAGGTEMFTRTGSDGRVNGIGNISLVAGALSDRGTSGPNANRGWYTITVPEPAAIAGAAGALLLLAGCHQLVRRRSR